MMSIKCPFCGFSSDEDVYKKLRKPWRFRFYTVKMLKCPKCGGVFNYYEGVSPKGKQSVFVIKIRPRGRK